MSYILEALKKSQQERSRGQVPDLQSLHQSVAVSDRNQPRWPYWALGASLLVLAFMLGWLRPWAAPAISEMTEARPTISSMVKQDEVVALGVVSQPVAEPAPQRISPPPGPVIVTEPRQASVAQQDMALNSVPDISELPGLLQQSIPHMQFAGHVYSSNPKHRSVIINGRYMSEGDELMSGLRLQQITADSVIFDTQGQKFKVAVLHGWSFK